MAGLLPGLREFKLDASTDALLLENDSTLRGFRQIAMRYQMRDFLFVAVVPQDDILAPASLEVVSKIRDGIAALPAVRDVISVLDVPLLSTFDGGFADVALSFETLRTRDTDIAAARQELTTSPIYRDMVASGDGRVSAMQIFLKDHPTLPRLSNLRDELLYKRAHGGLSAPETLELERLRPEYEQAKEEAETANHRAIAAIRAVLDGHRGEAEIYLGGLPMIIDDMLSFIANDLAVFSGAVFLFLVIMLALIFREARFVALPLASCIYSNLAMLGLLGLIGWKVTIISSNFSALMLILTMSMNIHLVVRYRELLRDHPEWEQAELVGQTMRSMLVPSLFTVVTNIIGFASFVLCDIKPVIDFGWMMAAGLIIAFVTTFVLFPAVLVLLPKRQPRRAERAGYAVTAWLGQLTANNGTAVLVVALALAVLAIIGARKLEVENSFVSYFGANTEIHRGLELIDRHLGGTTPLDVILKFDPADEAETTADASGSGDLAAMFDDVARAETRPLTWFSARKLARIAAVHDYLDGLPEVGKVMSFASTLRVAQQMNEGRALTPEEVEDLYRRVPDAVKVNLVTPYVAVHDHQVRVSARIVDTQPGLSRDELLTRIAHDLHKRLGLAPDEFELSGLLVLYNNVLQSLFRSQILTLGTAMLCILVPLVVMFRSLKAGLICLAPNVLAALVILGSMGFAGIPLDIMTITIAAITIGIAVEDSIHYMYSYRDEYARRGDAVATLHHCHGNIAKAGFYTTITVVVGFGILVLSNFIPTILFGALTALAMIAALLGALTLMPKLLLIWQPFRAAAEAL
jgi:predicted RND superfamily exporter protein